MAFRRHLLGPHGRAGAGAVRLRCSVVAHAPPRRPPRRRKPRRVCGVASSVDAICRSVDLRNAPKCGAWVRTRFARVAAGTAADNAQDVQAVHPQVVVAVPRTAPPGHRGGGNDGAIASRAIAAASVDSVAIHRRRRAPNGGAWPRTRFVVLLQHSANWGRRLQRFPPSRSGSATGRRARAQNAPKKPFSRNRKNTFKSGNNVTCEASARLASPPRGQDLLAEHHPHRRRSRQAYARNP